MSADAPWRGAAAFAPQPLSEDEEYMAQYMVASVEAFNSRDGTRDIEFRSSDGDIDARSHVFRFDTTPYEHVFLNGFRARSDTPGTEHRDYCNLAKYVNSGGRPLDTRRPTTYVFVSTTRSSSWHPRVDHKESIYIYRYEIYAPGGILVAETLRDLYQYPRQDEVAFIRGIAPQYIRSAQLFEITTNGRYSRSRRVDDILYINRNFNPQSHPPRDLRIRLPVSFYLGGNRQRMALRTEEFPKPDPRQEPDQEGQRRIKYYKEDVTQICSYIDSAFRSTNKNEAYIFIKQKYVLINYAPGSTNDRILDGSPHNIGESFPSLAGTAFAEYGIDASFACHRNAEAFIFSGNLCALINFAPRSTGDWILEGTKTIRQMFPFFRGTIFDKGVDAAFESTVTGEAYLFKGSDYALVNYDKEELIAIRPITDGFPCLRGTEFERDVDAAFASHTPNQAYLFKGNTYILFHFTPGENKDYIINGPKEIVPGIWPALTAILPVRNIGLDVLESPQSTSN